MREVGEYCRSYFVCISAFLLFTFLVFTANVSAQKERAINDVQGEKVVSPYEGKTVRLTGIVTARTRSGFYIQTPDDQTDNNPLTSEGIFVFTKTEPGAEATIGNLVSVSGDVTKFLPKQEPASLPVTELSMEKNRDEIVVISKNNALPKPITLTVEDFKSNLIDQLEKYEGMRVRIDEMTVTAPTKGRVDGKNAASVSGRRFLRRFKENPKTFS